MNNKNDCQTHTDRGECPAQQGETSATRPSRIVCFLPYIGKEQTGIIEMLQKEKSVHRIILLTTKEPRERLYKGCPFVRINNLYSSATMQRIARHCTIRSSHLLFYNSEDPLQLTAEGFRKFLHTAIETKAGMVYSDHYEKSAEEAVLHPLIDYQPGSLRDNFDFGPLMLFRSDFFKTAVSRIPTIDYAALYYVRLFIAKECNNHFVHLTEPLYTCQKKVSRSEEEEHFDYVDPKNQEVQKEMEKVCTLYLKSINAYLPFGQYESVSHDFPKLFSFSSRNHPRFGASVIIPVRNRVRTIGDAIQSALRQQCRDREYNILVVDNHSTDGTGAVIDRFAAEDERVLHLIPEQTDLGIGGCWNYAVHHPACKEVAIQLDSDDLYSNEMVVDRITSVFETKRCAAVVGSYRITDFNLNALPPGIIDHREWTAENGRNNALRINGFGAPRAFLVPVLKAFPFPNTSYGEDYAVMLAISRRYPIERIYEVQYLCRRWEGNSDANLTLEQANANNLYKDRIRTQEIEARIQELKPQYPFVKEDTINRFFREQLVAWHMKVESRSILKWKEHRLLDNTLSVQYNASRKRSTEAKTDAASLAERPCFLCKANRIIGQISLPCFGHFEAMVNPYPIMPYHLTIVHKDHTPQTLQGNLSDFVRYAKLLSSYIHIYNGPKCGASAPDHAHFQIFKGRSLPIIKMVEAHLKARELQPFTVIEETRLYVLRKRDVPMFLIEDESPLEYATIHLIEEILQSLPLHEGEQEPRVNLIVWSTRKEHTFFAIIPRSKHRPDCYAAEGKERLRISPGAIDMGGLMIVTNRPDYIRLTAEKAHAILREVALSEQEMETACQTLWRRIKR